MRVVFLSNYFNHHQKPFSDAMYKRLGADYVFIETDEMGEFRKKLGYEMESLPEYVLPMKFTLANFEAIKEIINEADVLVTGAAPEKYLKERKKKRKLIFRYSEKLFRKGKEPFKYIVISSYRKWISRHIPIFCKRVNKRNTKQAVSGETSWNLK